jgi:hypothetical protein
VIRFKEKYRAHYLLDWRNYCITFVHISLNSTTQTGDI